MTLELTYSHNQQQKQTLKKCSICHNTSAQLLKLPDNFQEFSKQKGFESWFCCSCIQVVNFLRNDQ